MVAMLNRETMLTGGKKKAQLPVTLAVEERLSSKNGEFGYRNDPGLNIASYGKIDRVPLRGDCYV